MTTPKKIIVDQSGANIGIDFVGNLNVKTIAGTVTNGKAAPDRPGSDKPSIAVGFTDFIDPDELDFLDDLFD